VLGTGQVIWTLTNVNLAELPAIAVLAFYRPRCQV
jgi:hypothetical protein